jgi:hypothetical protein
MYIKSIIPAAEKDQEKKAETPEKETAYCGSGAVAQSGISSAGDAELSCIGEHALFCENATGIVADDVFPTSFEIEKSENSCNFKLSYPAHSMLADDTGKSLAGQYISCPLSVVKKVDMADLSLPKFLPPDTADKAAYAEEIYFYGTVGIFAEHDLDKEKIESLGCSGPYIDTMIAGYRAEQ